MKLFVFDFVSILFVGVEVVVVLKLFVFDFVNSWFVDVEVVAVLKLLVFNVGIIMVVRIESWQYLGVGSIEDVWCMVCLCNIVIVLNLLSSCPVQYLSCWSELCCSIELVAVLTVHCVAMEGVFNLVCIYLGVVLNFPSIDLCLY